MQYYVQGILNYPQAAHQERRDGVALIQLTIKSNGAITDVALNNSSGHQDLDENAVQTVQEIKFFPNNGCMVETATFTVKLPVDYVLDDPQSSTRSESGWKMSMQRDIAAAIKWKSFYPKQAHANRLEGVAIVTMVITPEGRISHLWLDQSSSHAVLDQAALATVRKISPDTLKRNYPPGAPEVIITVPFNYKLNGFLP